MPLKGLLCICLLLCGSGADAQRYSLSLTAGKDQALLDKIGYQRSFATKPAMEKELRKVLLACYDNAYLLAGYDSIFSDSLTAKAFLSFGEQYRWAKLRKGNVDEGVLSEIGFREKLYANKPVNYKSVRRIRERLIRYYENNGYPFASVKLDSIEISGNMISAALSLEKHTEEKIDSVIIKGSAKIAPVYIYNYLGIKPKDRYNEAQLVKVNARLRELPFITMSKPSTVIFTDRYNKLTLFLDKKRASQFDGILGILPDNKTGKVLFTGDVRLKLQNGLSHGELIELNWRRLQTQTQDLKVHIVYPFILRTPFGVDYNFKLYKKDTTYLDVNQNVGLQYLLIGGNFLKVFYSNKTSNLLSTKGLEYATTLPAYADVRVNMYGIGLRYEKLDYRLNPRRGFTVTVNASAGTKHIKQNANLNPVAYENLKLNSAQYNADLEGALFFPLASRSTVMLGNQTAFLYSETMFQNELFRIGGLKSLRGFDEESIFASTYSIMTLEYRFILEQNSYIYLFGDGAWYENNNVKEYVTDQPFGFGAGISFETKAGIFSINYALGKQFSNPIALKSGKIHFGIVNYF
jgi:outer membrane protein assembly factor BamA